jgi:hypothetical protein
MNTYLLVKTLHIISAAIVFGTGDRRRLAGGSLAMRGATPCLDLIDLDTHLKAFAGLNISIVRDAIDA